MSREEARAEKLPILSLLANVFRIYSEHWRVLIPLALVVLIIGALFRGVRWIRRRSRE